ncbi:MAG: cytochrome c [Desulfobulbaceae bacterium]|nr:cytochrome c [Desulfobulbaceae bacterium]
MRKIALKYASFTVLISLICGLILIFVLRNCAIYPVKPLRAGDGFDLFVEKGCVECHFTQSRGTKVGPGLKGLFQGKTLPMSGREATEENVRKQLKTPYKDMPSFAKRLSEEERTKLIEFLKKL